MVESIKVRVDPKFKKLMANRMKKSNINSFPEATRRLADEISGTSFTKDFVKVKKLKKKKGFDDESFFI